MKAERGIYDCGQYRAWRQYSAKHCVGFCARFPKQGYRMVFASICEYASSAIIFESMSSDEFCLASSKHFRRYLLTSSSSEYLFLNLTHATGQITHATDNNCIAKTFFFSSAQIVQFLSSIKFQIDSYFS